MVTQMALMKGMMPAIVSDIKFENVINAFHYAGIKDEDIAVAHTLEEANKYMEMGKFVATDNSDIIARANLVDCAIDVTGVPEVGVKIAVDAMNNHKHVVMMDVETDVVIGSYLKNWATRMALSIRALPVTNRVPSWNCIPLHGLWG